VKHHPLVVPILAGALLALVAARTWAWPQVASQNVGLGAQSAFLDHGNATCSDGLGGSFLAWTDVRGPNHVYVQHLDATGAVVAGWPANGLDVSPLDTSIYANYTVMGIYPSGTGSAIVAWRDSNSPWINSYQPLSTNWAQRVADPAAGGPRLWQANGVPLTDFVPQGNTATSGDGGVLLAYTYRDTVHVQKLDGSGTKVFGDLGAPVNTHYWPYRTDVPYENPRPASDGLGGAFVIWEAYHGNGVGTETAIQHIDATGLVAAGAWGPDGVMVSVDPVWDQAQFWVPEVDKLTSRVIPDGMGGAIVTWDDFVFPRGSVSYDGLSAQRFSADGTALWDQSASGGNAYVRYDVFEDWTYQHGLCPDGAGGAFIAYRGTDSPWQAGPQYGVRYIHAAGADGSRLPGGLLASLTPSNNDAAPDIVSDGLGGAIIAWQRGDIGGTYDIVTQHLDNLGNLLQGPDGASLTLDAYDQSSPKVALDGGVGAIVSWIDQRPGIAPSFGTTKVGATTAVGNMFAQQVNSIGQLGGPVIGTYTAGVTPPARPAALAVHGGVPNPAVDRMRIAFSLPGDGAARLEVVDVAGRRVWSQDVGTMGAGRHVADLGATRGAAPGLYFIRLRQGGHTATGRVMLLR
jgi:hypothetical protein